MQISDYTYLLLLIALPIVGGLLLQFLKWQRAKREAFAESRFQSLLFSKNKWFSRWIPSLYLFAFLFLIFAMIDLLAGKQKMSTQQKVSNILFLLDVSNSMNAEDIAPNRLTEAKNILIHTLPHIGGNRIGLIAFAGEASSIMPLTTDISATENYINGIETSLIKVQGTDFLKAVKVATEKFKSIPKGARQVVIISDGEDNEGNENEAINLAKKEGINISTIGIGSDDGAPIPEYFYGQLMGYKADAYGETIISKRQKKALIHIAEKTGGIYTNGNNMNQAVQHISEYLKSKKEGSTINIDAQNSEHYYQYFLGISLFLFLLIYLINPKKDLNL